MHKCQIAGCTLDATSALTDMRGSQPAQSQWRCELHCSEFMDNYARSISSSAETTAQRRKEVRFEVELLVNSVDKDPHELFLREVGGERRMALQPYYCEAWAIAWLLQGVNSPRPLTHSIFVRTVAALGAQIENVLIHDVVDGLLHARVRIVHLSGAVDIDARASDCVAIALASNAPILVAERLL